MPESIFSIGGLKSQLPTLRGVNAPKFTSFLHGLGLADIESSFTTDLDHVLALESAERDVLDRFQIIHLRFVSPHDLSPSTLQLTAYWAGMHPRLETLHLFGLVIHPKLVFPFIQALSRCCPSLHTLLVEDQEYKIPAFLAQHDIIFPSVTSSSPRPSPYATLPDLVDDVLQIILSMLKISELYTLLMVNRRLHRSALLSFLRVCGARWSSNALRISLSSSYATLDALSGLAISPVITSLNRLSCTIPKVSSAHLLFLQLHRLHRFITRLDACKEVELILEGPSSRRGSSRLTEIWESSLFNLMKRMVEHNCTKLEVRGGVYFIQGDIQRPMSNPKPSLFSRISRIFQPKAFKPPELPHPPTCLFRRFGEPSPLFHSAGGEHNSQLQFFSLDSGLTRPTTYPLIYKFLQNSPHLTHLCCQFPLDSYTNALPGFIGSGPNIYITSFNLFLNSVPTLIYLKVYPLYCAQITPPPPPHLPNLQELYTSCGNMRHLVNGENTLPSIKSIGILESHTDRVPCVPSPDLLLQISRYATSHPNFPELFIDLNLNKRITWIPHELGKYAKAAEWAEATTPIKKLIFRNFDALRKFTPHHEIDCGILLQVIKLFPNVSHVRFLETMNIPRTPRFERSFKALSESLSTDLPLLIWDYDFTSVDTI
ncbi:hypothetical protein BDN72DRAFT_525566 [Pluteus cervinus]|uniref:Uncharacterized protein n=1 Tax=Pluteus cervinus TaxID=181527 RepID=A0ACD3AYK8_9AGAR|nr:hypothetical protein BDN72DRAFT_525566 [Pluteus cervinus]